jgi:hypothetical protein
MVRPLKTPCLLENPEPGEVVLKRNQAVDVRRKIEWCTQIL